MSAVRVRSINEFITEKLVVKGEEDIKQRQSPLITIRGMDPTKKRVETKVTFGLTEFRPGQKVAQHCHHHDTVKFYKSGTVRRAHHCNQGDALFFPAGSAYSVEDIGTDPALIHTSLPCSMRPFHPSPSASHHQHDPNLHHFVKLD